MEQNLKHLSKFLSLILRHKPETIGLQNSKLIANALCRSLMTIANVNYEFLLKDG